MPIFSALCIRNFLFFLISSPVEKLLKTLTFLSGVIYPEVPKIPHFCPILSPWTAFFLGINAAAFII